MTVSLRIIGYGALPFGNLLIEGESRGRRWYVGKSERERALPRMLNSDTRCKIGKRKCTIEGAARRRPCLFVADVAMHLGLLVHFLHFPRVK